MVRKAPLSDLASLIAAARADARAVLTEPEAKAFLRAQGIPVPAGLVVARPEQAAAAVAEIGPPVVVKAVAHRLTHKSEAGAVLFPIDTPAAAAAACRQVAAGVGAHRPDIKLEGFLIEAYRPAQPEWILALRNDPGFGPALMFGLGGIYVDMLRHVSFRLAPLSDDDIDALITDKPAMRILDGARGRPPADRVALKNTIRRLSDLTLQPKIMREIADIEINPLTITREGVMALDALIVLCS
jgi:succinyl-CoA synthetase beta subunit